VGEGLLDATERGPDDLAAIERGLNHHARAAVVDANHHDPGAGKAPPLHLVEAQRSQLPDAHPSRRGKAAGKGKKGDVGELSARHGEVASRQRVRLCQERSPGIPAGGRVGSVPREIVVRVGCLSRGSEWRESKAS